MEANESLRTDKGLTATSELRCVLNSSAAQDPWELQLSISVAVAHGGTACNSRLRLGKAGPRLV